MTTCPRCNGAGEAGTVMGSVKCWFCKGAGNVNEKQYEMYIEGARLRQLRVDAGMTLKAAAQAAHMPAWYLSKIEHGEAEWPNVPEVKKSMVFPP